MIDSLVAAWHRLADGLSRTGLGRASARIAVGPATPAPIADGFYLALATRFEVGRLRNLMLAYGGKGQIRSLSATLKRWRRFPEAYLILKRAAGGVCIEPFLGGGVLMGLSNKAGEALMSGKKSWSSVGTRELCNPPTRHIYAQFAEAVEKEHRAALLRELTARVMVIGTADCWFIARPATEPALHFYRHRGFVRPGGGAPVLNDICFTEFYANPKLKAVQKALSRRDGLRPD
ncbi:MAG: hypothetical protein ABIO40_05840 [Devosia sp.]